MIPEIKISEIVKLAEQYGKVNVLEFVRKHYVEHYNQNIGLCLSLFCALAYLVEKQLQVEVVDLWFCNENGSCTANSTAFKAVFPQWCKYEAWKLTYKPDVAMYKFSKTPIWYQDGYWWPRDDNGVRIEFLDKLIDIYKKEEHDEI